MKGKHWYAMYVKMHHEKKTAERLSKMGITNYLPLQEVVRKWSDRKKKMQQVIIPMMIFINTDDRTRIEILNLVPSINGTFIDKATNKPAIIRDEEMERFMFMLDYSDTTVKFISKPMSPGEKVEVVKGPLSGLAGEFVESNGKSHVSVRIDMLGYALVDIPQDFIRKIDNGN